MLPNYWYPIVFSRALRAGGRFPYAEAGSISCCFATRPARLAACSTAVPIAGCRCA